MIRVFPAIPDQWKKEGVSFRRLRGWNGILVSSKIMGNKVAFIQLEATRKGLYRITNCFEQGELVIEKKNKRMVQSYLVGSSFNIALNAGESCRIYTL
jgi:hypothetical protein